MTRALPLLLLALGACKKPPEAPEGLDASSRFLFREFEADDDVIGAGLTGLMNWYDEDGDELLGAKADLESVGSFSLQPLETSDVERLPLADDGRDLENAVGIVALAQMKCDWTEAEALLVRHDQEVVFEGSFVDYDRTYLTSRPTFESATDATDFPRVREALELYADDLDLGDLEAAVLMTENTAVTKKAGVTMEFTMQLHLRHGTFDVQGEPTEALLILTFLPEAAYGEGGTNSMQQSYSIEVNVARGNETLRLLATWVHIDSILNDGAVATAGVNESQSAAERMSAICAGDIDIPAE